MLTNQIYGIDIMHTLLIGKSGKRTRVAIIEKKSNKLASYDEASPHSKQLRGTIYNAVATSVCPEFDAVFVKYDKKRNDGFLPLDNISNSYFGLDIDEPLTAAEKAKRIKPGMQFIVQVRKDQMAHSEKGAALTTELSLAGRYLVILPYSSKQAVSRRADGDQRDKVKDLIQELNPPKNMGIIIRTAGIDCSISDLRQDFDTLCKQWEYIQQHSKSSGSICLLHEEESVVIRSLRDMNNQTADIVVNDQELFDFTKNYLQATRPDLNIEECLHYYDEAIKPPMMWHYSVEAQIDQIFEQNHSLPGGGSIVIQGTEAGHMVDVNSGSSSSGNNIEETALSTNLQAAEAVASILKLRDTGGIIIIDFIDMLNRDNRSKVEQHFAALIDNDRAKIKVEPISTLTGCMSVLRQRMGSPFFESSLTSINDDDQVVMGMKRSVESYAYKVLSIIENSAHHQSHLIHVQVPTDVASYLLNEERESLNNFERRYNTEITIIPAPYKQFKYTLKRFRADDNQALPEQPKSYEQIPPQPETPEWTPPASRSKDTHKLGTPGRSHRKNNPTSRKTGLITSLWTSIFGSDDSKAQTQKSKKPYHHKRSSGNDRRHSAKKPNSPHHKRTQRNRSADKTGQSQERTPGNQHEQTHGNQQERQPRQDQNRSSGNSLRRRGHRRPRQQDPNKQPSHNANTIDSLQDD